MSRGRLCDFDQHHWTDSQYNQAIDVIKRIINSEDFKRTITQHGKYKAIVACSIYGNGEFIVGIDGMLDNELEDENYTYSYVYSHDLKKKERSFEIRAYPKN